MRFASTKRFLAIILVLAMLFTQIGLMGVFAEESKGQNVLVITGTGVKTELTYTLEQLMTLNEGKTTQYYSSINRVGTKKLQAGEGIDLAYLLKLAGAEAGYGKITFVAADGFRREFSEEQISAKRYYYPNILNGNNTGAAEAKTLIAYKNAAITSGAIAEAQLKSVENDPPLQVMFGQLNMEDVNNSMYVSALTKIIIGDELNVNEEESTANSTYKHISYEGQPYNIDAVTSATLTIEGPGVEERQIITLRQLEDMEAGIYRGTYSEKIDGSVVENTYEGVTVDYLLNNLVKLKPNAGKVIFWDNKLQKLGEFSLADIAKADSKGNKLMIAYGVNGVPFVFNKESAGYASGKYNDNGCTKLIMNSEQAKGLVGFGTVSKLQITEDDSKGIYEHAYSPYNKPEYLNDTITITGDGIGKEVIYSIKDIEALAIRHRNIGFEGMYSLQNSASYWNNHTLKGAKLYELLLLSGMSPDLPDSTPVEIIAKDGYNVGAFTLGDIKDASKYGIYIKGMEKPVSTGLPVLLSYGSDGYPFVSINTDEGFVNGVDNNGGPLRVTFGQTSLEDINGPKQIKYAAKIIVGSEVNYPTHEALANNPMKDNLLNIKVYSSEAQEPIKEAAYTIGDIEKTTYSKKTSIHSLVRNYYPTKKGINLYNDFYQGISLSYLLKEMVGLPGIEGTVIFRSGDKELGTIEISELNSPNGDYSEYYNSINGSKNLKPILAYSKNGYPLTTDYLSKNGYTASNGVSINGYKMMVRNYGGPLMAILGQSSERPEGLSVQNVDGIEVRLAPDSCSHTKAPYSSYDNTLTIKGDGIKSEVSLKATEIEEMLDYIDSSSYYVLNKMGIGESVEYKGVGVYDLLRTAAQLQPNAEKITIVAEDGYSKDFTLQEAMKNDYINELNNTSNLKMLLAYSKNKMPLVPSKDSEGYDEEAANNGGPLMLVLGQKEAGHQNSSSFVKNVKEIIVTAGEMESWNHNSAMYEGYLDTVLLRITGSEIEKPVTLTLRELEALAEGIVRDTYTSSQDAAQFEGIELKYLIKEAVKLKTGIEIPSKLTIYSGSKYQRNLDVNQAWNGVTNTKGEDKKIIIGYAREGYPLVPNAGDPGYVNGNSGGPIKLIVEENISMWIKWVDVIVVGEGEYEEPAIEEQKE